MYRVVTKLKALKKELRKFNLETFGNLKEKIDAAWKQLQQTQWELMQDRFNEEVQERERQMVDKYSATEKLLLSQLHRQTKLDRGKEGNVNSRMFHATMKKRRATNRIHLITLDDGTVLSEPAVIVEHTVGYYRQLLGRKWLGNH